MGERSERGECAKSGTRREGEGMKRRRVRWCVRAGARRGGKSKSVQVEEGWGAGGESGTEIRGVTGDGRARWNFSYLVGGEYHARRQQFAVRRRKALRDF